MTYISLIAASISYTCGYLYFVLKLHRDANYYLYPSRLFSIAHKIQIIRKIVQTGVACSYKNKPTCNTISVTLSYYAFTVCHVYIK